MLCFFLLLGYLLYNLYSLLFIYPILLTHFPLRIPQLQRTIKFVMIFLLEQASFLVSNHVAVAVDVVVA